MKLPPFALERYFARHEFGARHLLCASDCESTSIDELLSLEPEAKERFLGQRLGYTDSRGSPALRQAISRHYATIDPEHVLVGSGAEEAIYLFMHAVLAPGDHLIVHEPCYQSLAEVARSIGCRVDAWPAREEEGWALDPADLPRLARPDTRVIVLNTPHNPTGWHMPAALFRDVAAFSRERGITLFSDEVYRGLEHAGRDSLPAACDLAENAVSLGVMSKTYGLAGLRIGWVACRDAAILSRMAALKDYTTICSAAPSEFLAELALRHSDALASRSVRIIERNLDILDGFFSRHDALFRWRRPAAGPVAFPCLLAGDIDSFCDEALAASGVLLLPGSVYGDTGNHFRVGFGRTSMPQAVERLEEYLGLD